MKTTETVVSVIILFSSLCSGILTGSEHITDNPVFGCKWNGGFYPGVSCICREDAEVKII